MDTLETLTHAVDTARKILQGAERRLIEFKTSPENNVFKDLEEAKSVLYETLRGWAFEDCQGAGNCGNAQYTQEFIVDGVRYTAVGNFQYNRYDKQYYYIDEDSYSITEVGRDQSV